jgi:hypothetical protein
MARTTSCALRRGACIRRGGPTPALADRHTALGDLVQAITGAPPKLQLHAPAALELLPALADCAAPSRYDALVSESEPATRARIWRLRLALADTFLPRADDPCAA